MVFYKGRPPKGVKTDWIMHEYRLNDSRSQPTKKIGSMRVCSITIFHFTFNLIKILLFICLFVWFLQLDDWVLCRIYKKKSPERPLERIEENVNVENVPREDNNVMELQSMKIPRTFSLAHLWELESLGSISHLLGDDHDTNYDNNTGPTVSQSSSLLQDTRLREPCFVKFEDNYQNGNLNHTSFYNPMLEFQ